MKPNLAQLYTPHVINENDAQSVRSHIFESFEQDGSSHDAFQTMYEFFLANDFKKESLLPYAHTYWTWFTKIIWDNLDLIKDEKSFIDVVRHTAPYALAQGYDVLDIYFSYFMSRADEFPNISGLHVRLGQVLKNTNTPISLLVEPSFSVKDVIDMVQKNNNLDAIASADFLAKLERQIFSGTASLSLEDESLERVESIRNLVALYYLCIFTSDIEPNVREYFFDKLDQPTEHVDIDPKAYNIGYLNILLEEKGEKPIGGDALFYDFDIFEYIEKMSASVKADPKSPEIITGFLGDVANLRQNPRINDVYFYNEATGKFEWDEALLRELELVPEDDG